MNYLAIFVVALGVYVLGALWYSPLLFGNQWMKLVGFSKKDMEKAKKDGKMGLRYGAMFLSVLVLTYVLAYFVGALGAVTFVSGLLVGFWAWLGFLATTMLGMVLWENKPFTLYLLNASHYLVILALAGGVLAIW